MAKATKPVVTTSTVEERLTALHELQKIDSQIDNVHKLKGELPEEVNALNEEIEQIEERIERVRADIKDLELKVAKSNADIGEAENLINKYERQQDQIKNNREYESIMQQIELQQLEIQLSQKRIRETRAVVANKEILLEGTIKRRDQKLKELEAKKEELRKIIAKTDKDEKNYQKQREKARKAIDERMLAQYDRLRTFYFRDGLAIVSIDRTACGGCHQQIPPQIQVELRHRKRILNCEHCGRVLIDRALAYGEEFANDDSPYADYGDFVDSEWEE
jgi:predicted  nucleic acid-binding Zn-ribbon protein